MAHFQSVLTLRNLHFLFILTRRYAHHFTRVDGRKDDISARMTLDTRGDALGKELIDGVLHGHRHLCPGHVEGNPFDDVVGGFDVSPHNLGIGCPTAIKGDDILGETCRG